MWVENGSPIFYGIESENIDYVWDEVKDFIEASILDKDSVTIDQLYESITDRDMQLWVGATPDDEIVLAAVTEIQILATGHKRFNCGYVGGVGVNEWVSFLDVYLENFAKKNNCKSMQIMGRRGWLRMLPEYKEVLTLMKKEL